jgi:hypothetical protein
MLKYFFGVWLCMHTWPAGAAFMAQLPRLVSKLKGNDRCAAVPVARMLCVPLPKCAYVSFLDWFVGCFAGLWVLH